MIAFLLLLVQKIRISVLMHDVLRIEFDYFPISFILEDIDYKNGQKRKGKKWKPDAILIFNLIVRVLRGSAVTLRALRIPHRADAPDKAFYRTSVIYSVIYPALSVLPGLTDELSLDDSALSPTLYDSDSPDSPFLDVTVETELFTLLGAVFIYLFSILRKLGKRKWRKAK